MTGDTVFVFRPLCGWRSGTAPVFVTRQAPIPVKSGLLLLGRQRVRIVARGAPERPLAFLKAAAETHLLHLSHRLAIRTRFRRVYENRPKQLQWHSGAEIEFPPPAPHYPRLALKVALFADRLAQVR